MIAYNLEEQFQLLCDPQEVLHRTSGEKGEFGDLKYKDQKDRMLWRS